MPNRVGVRVLRFVNKPESIDPCVTFRMTMETPLVGIISKSGIFIKRFYHDETIMGMEWVVVGGLHPVFRDEPGCR